MALPILVALSLDQAGYVVSVLRKTVEDNPDDFRGADLLAVADNVEKARRIVERNNREKHDYEPGERIPRMSTDPECRICGRPKH